MFIQSIPSHVQRQITTRNNDKKKLKRTNEDGKCCQAHRPSAPWILWDAAEIYLDRFPIWRILDFIYFFFHLRWLLLLGRSCRANWKKKKLVRDENSRASHRLILDSLSCMFGVSVKKQTKLNFFFLFAFPHFLSLAVVGAELLMVLSVCIGLAVVATRRAQREDLNLATSRWAERYLFSSFSLRGQRERNQKF